MVCSHERTERPIQTDRKSFRSQLYSGRFANFVLNKKVLLPDRKRRTARCVASTRSAVLPWGESVPQSWLGGTPVLSQRRGGYPSPGQGGCIPVLSWLGGGVLGTPQLRFVYSLARTGVPSHLGLGHLLVRTGEPPPHLGLGHPLARTEVPLERTWDQRPGKEPGTGVPPRKDLGLGYSPVWTDRLTPVKTLPSRRTTYTNYQVLFIVLTSVDTIVASFHITSPSSFFKMTTMIRRKDHKRIISYS